MIYSLSFGKMTDSERALALSLQGIVNRKNKEVFIDVDKYSCYLEDEPIQQTDVLSLLEKYKDYFDGFVSYNLSDRDLSINIATTISAAHEVLGVPKQLEQAVITMGLKKLFDLTQLQGDDVDKQKIVFDACLPFLNKDGLVHQVVRPNNFHLRLRDLAICRRFACVYTDESDKGREFRRYVLSKLNANIPIYGWTTDEITFVKDVSSFGDYVLPSDWSCNHSFFNNAAQEIKQTRRNSPVKQGKHFVALVVSDGDNLQWLERDFSMPCGNFGQRVNTAQTYKMNWTFSPSMAQLCPQVASNIFAMAKNDYFICSVSGIGYANLLRFPREHLQAFTQKTVQAMQNSHLRIVCMLDNVIDTTDENHVQEVLNYYSQYDTILGGVWELDPDRYASGKGKIFWSNGKPFVSVRFTLWHPSCQMSQVTNQWLKDLALQVNAMPVSENTEEGYSVINVHPWTMTQQSVDYFVSQLDREKIEIVYIDEMLELLRKNVGDKKW